jgi:metal-responsive CopG/Arc/MetJ family transcriptional regulator
MINRVKLPVELGDEVDKILEKKLLGYRSRAESVAEAVRDKMIQVKKIKCHFLYQRKARDYLRVVNAHNIQI